MIDLTPEQEAAAHAALDEKEARTKAQVIQVKPGAIERNGSIEAAHCTIKPTPVADTPANAARVNISSSSIVPESSLSRFCNGLKRLLAK